MTDQEATPETLRRIDTEIGNAIEAIDHADYGDAFAYLSSVYGLCNKHATAWDRLLQVEREAKDMEATLREIAKGEGRFSLDPLKHASNTVEDMKALADAALAKEEKRPGHHIVDDESAGLICEHCGMGYEELMAARQLNEPCAALAKETITDDCGNTWSKRCSVCGKNTLQLIRPGVVQCSECG